jgi:hypothetical protein
MARRTIHGPFSDLKMFATYKVRFSNFYGDNVLGTAMAALALGERNGKYGKYGSARSAATPYAKDAGLYGPLAGQVQTAVMNLMKMGIPEGDGKCEYITSYVRAKGLVDVQFGEGGVYQTAADAVLAYFGCTPLSEGTRAVAGFTMTPIQPLPTNG